MACLTLKIKITQQEKDIFSEEWRKSIMFYGIPLAGLNAGSYLYITRKHRQSMGRFRRIMALCLGLFGYYVGKTMGFWQVDRRFLQECPDGNMAKYIRAKKGEGEYPSKVIVMICWCFNSPQIKITQQEKDILSGTWWKSIFLYGIPLGCLHMGLCYQTITRHGLLMTRPRQIKTLCFGIIGFYVGRRIGTVYGDMRLLRECPDGNMAKYLNARREGKNLHEDPKAELPANDSFKRSGPETSSSTQTEPSMTMMTSEDNITSPSRKMKTNKYGDVIEEG